jgi:hypothetical protein
MVSAFGFQRDAAGDVVTRFRVGTELFVRMLSLCASDQILRVSLSEPGTLARSTGAVQITAARELMSRGCQISTKLSTTPGGSDLYLDCGSIEPGLITVSIDAESLEGMKVRAFGAEETGFLKEVDMIRSEPNNDCIVWFAWGNTMPQASAAQ